jgi:hypothetical protein
MWIKGGRVTSHYEMKASRRNALFWKVVYEDDECDKGNKN